MDEVGNADKADEVDNVDKVCQYGQSPFNPILNDIICFNTIIIFVIIIATPTNLMGPGVSIHRSRARSTAC